MHAHARAHDSTKERKGCCSLSLGFNLPVPFTSLPVTLAFCTHTHALFSQRRFCVYGDSFLFGVCTRAFCWHLSAVTFAKSCCEASPPLPFSSITFPDLFRRHLYFFFKVLFASPLLGFVTYRIFLCAFFFFIHSSVLRTYTRYARQRFLFILTLVDVTAGPVST